MAIRLARTPGSRIVLGLGLAAVAGILSVFLSGAGHGWNTPLLVSVILWVILPVTLFIGVATYIRIVDARLEDYWLVYGMNRLRHAYLEIAPGLEPYFITGHHDDPQGVTETYGPHTEMRFYRLIASTSMLVGVIDAALAGIIAGLFAAAVGGGPAPSIVIGAVVTAVSVVLLIRNSRRFIDHGRRSLHSHFGRQIDAG